MPPSDSADAPHPWSRTTGSPSPQSVKCVSRSLTRVSTPPPHGLPEPVDSFSPTVRMPADDRSPPRQLHALAVKGVTLDPSLSCPALGCPLVPRLLRAEKDAAVGKAGSLSRGPERNHPHGSRGPREGWGDLRVGNRRRRGGASSLPVRERRLYPGAGSRRR